MISNIMCPICLEELEADDLVVTTNVCKHLLCLQCGLDHYIVYHGDSCPYCRQVSRTFLIKASKESNARCRPLCVIDCRDWYVTRLSQVNTEDITDRVEQSLIQRKEHVVVEDNVHDGTATGYRLNNATISLIYLFAGVFGIFIGQLSQ